MREIYLSHFTPSQTDPELLEAIFVQRHALADDTVERILEGVTRGNQHHILLVGARGTGKTHFVSLIFHRLNQREELRDRLRLAWMGEDDPVDSLRTLLLRIYQALQRRYPQEFADEPLEAIYDQPRQAEKLLKELLLRLLGDRTLLVIVENLDEIFRGLGEEGQKKWRAWMQNHRRMLTLATSQQLFPGISSRQEPFFGFFQTEHLKRLDQEEAVQLLRKIAKQKADLELVQFLDSPTGRNRVRALHHLSGGNHRIYIILSQFLTRDALDELVTAFRKLLDELTPYYQSRLASLSPQQRKLVDFLCTCETTLSVKEIARRNFLEHNTVSSQLKTLRDSGYVISHARGRESLYELAEPLMRLCVEVKNNRQRPIPLIVEFLRIWYKRSDLEQRLGMSGVCSPLEIEYIQTALKRWVEDPLGPGIRAAMDAIVECSRKKMPKEKELAWEELESVCEKLWQWLNAGVDFWLLFLFDDALRCLDSAIRISPSDPLVQAFKCFIQTSVGNVGNSLSSYDRWEMINSEDLNFCVISCQFLQGLGQDQHILSATEEWLSNNPNDQTVRAFRVYALYRLECWDEGLLSLQRVLAGDGDYTLAFYALQLQDIVKSLVNHLAPEVLRKQHSEALVQLFKEHAQLRRLGDALVASLGVRSDKPVESENLASWNRIWQEVGAGFEELKIPLRLYDTGIRYLQTQDPLVLLDLVQEERRILAELLNVKLPY